MYVRHRRLPPRRGVVDAQGLIALVDAVQAVGRADAGADAVLLSGQHLAGDVRLGDVGAGHADHVQLALGDGVPGRGHVVDAGGVEGREPRRRPHLPGEIQVLRRAHAMDRDDVGQGIVGVHVAAHDVQEVHDAAAREAPGDLHPVLARQPDVPVLVRHHPHADQEARPHGVPHGLQHADGEAHPVVQAAAILVGAMVGGGRPELVRQVAIGVDLKPIQPGRLHPLGSGGVVRDDAVQVPCLGLLGKAAMRRFPHARWRQDRQPVRHVPGGAAAEMGQLDHDGRAMLMTLVCQAAQPGHDLVLVGQQVAEHRRTVRRHHGGPGGHGQRHAALRLFHVIQPVAILRHPVLGIGRLVRRAHDPVAERQVPQPEGLHQRVAAGGGGIRGGGARRGRDDGHRALLRRRAAAVPGWEAGRTGRDRRR